MTNLPVWLKDFRIDVSKLTEPCHLECLKAAKDRLSVNETDAKYSYLCNALYGTGKSKVQRAIRSTLRRYGCTTIVNLLEKHVPCSDYAAVQAFRHRLLDKMIQDVEANLTKGTTNA